MAVLRGSATTSVQTLSHLNTLLKAATTEPFALTDTSFAEAPRPCTGSLLSLSSPYPSSQMAREGIVDAYRLFLLDTSEPLPLDEHASALRAYLVDKVTLLPSLSLALTHLSLAMLP